MAFPVENIRAACAKRNTTLKQLEKDLGIGNGVIARWAKIKGTPPYGKILEIAEHLGVPVSELTGEEEQKEKPTPEGELSAEERKFFEWYRTQATERDKAIIRAFMEGEK